MLDLRVGEVVEVGSRDETLGTLDHRGELEALPFMPEMLQSCGRRFRVDKLVVKPCDTINWSGMYRMDHAVHLAGERCDGHAHGGCQASCLVTGRRPGSSGSTAASPRPLPARRRWFRPAGSPST